jgi:hypothetical protein
VDLTLSQKNPHPHPILLRSILILSYHPCLRLPGELLHSEFPAKILYTFLISSMRATWHTHLILLDTTALVFDSVREGGEDVYCGLVGCGSISLQP